MMNDAQIDILSRLDAMRAQEETVRRPNYFGGIDADGDAVDEACRRKMVAWLRQVQRALSLDPETTWIAASLLDRYLGSGRGDSWWALRSRRKFQLAAIAAYYTAVKVYEPVALGIPTLLKVCRGAYSESEIASMEREILEALDWRVACHTPMNFARELLLLVPELPPRMSDGILADCQKHLDDATNDIRFICSRPSDMGIRCLASSLAENGALSSLETSAIWVILADSLQSVQPPEEVAAARDMISELSFCGGGSASKLVAPPRRSVHGMDGGSSPVCVMRAPGQAQ